MGEQAQPPNLTNELLPKNKHCQTTLDQTNEMHAILQQYDYASAFSTVVPVCDDDEALEGHTGAFGWASKGVCCWLDAICLC